MGTPPLRAAAAAGGRLTAVVFVVLAVVGAAVAPIAVTLLAGPVAGLLLAVLAASIARQLGSSAHTRRVAWGAGAVGTLSPPFAYGVGLLGQAGAVVLVGMAIGGALALLAWSLDAPGDGVHHLERWLQHPDGGPEPWLPDPRV